MKQLEQLRVMHVQLAESELGLARATLVHELVQREEEGCAVEAIREALEQQDIMSFTALSGPIINTDLTVRVSLAFG